MSIQFSKRMKQPLFEKLPETIQRVCLAFAEGLKKALGENLHAIYLFGSVAFPDSFATGDLDFHVLTHWELDDDSRNALDRLHLKLAREYPPLGEELDCYYLLLTDAKQKTPPRSQMGDGAVDNNFALHRQHLRAGRCFVLYGPDPKDVYQEASWVEQLEALADELGYVEREMAKYPAYAVLNLCRLMYSFKSREVVASKAFTADWAAAAWPEWQSLIQVAVRAYGGQLDEAAEAWLSAGAGPFLEFACGVIAQQGEVEFGR